MRAVHKEPVWKSDWAKKKEAWEREKRRADDTIDEVLSISFSLKSRSFSLKVGGFDGPGYHGSGG